MGAVSLFPFKFINPKFPNPFRNETNFIFSIVEKDLSRRHLLQSSKCIVLTALNDHARSRQCIACSADDFLEDGADAASQPATPAAESQQGSGNAASALEAFLDSAAQPTNRQMQQAHSYSRCTARGPDPCPHCDPSCAHIPYVLMVCVTTDLKASCCIFFRSCAGFTLAMYTATTVLVVTML